MSDPVPVVAPPVPPGRRRTVLMDFDGDPVEVVTPPVPAGRRRTVLMDFDGVIVREDSLGQFLRHHLARAPWRIPGVTASMYAAAPLMGPAPLRPHGLRLIVRSLLAGWSMRSYEERAHLDRGDRLVVVTGSEGTLARAILDAAGLGDAELVASRVGPRTGGLGLEVHNYGAAKVVQLATHGIDPPWDVAYSDALSDLPMLGGARRPVLVGGSARTLARARAVLGPAVVQVRWP